MEAKFRPFDSGKLYGKPHAVMDERNADTIKVVFAGNLRINAT
ncbi:hypothetical protein [Stieleria marina]